MNEKNGKNNAFLMGPLVHLIQPEKEHQFQL